MEVRLPADKLTRIKGLLTTWLDKKKVTKCKILSLVGHQLIKITQLAHRIIYHFTNSYTHLHYPLQNKPYYCISHIWGSLTWLTRPSKSIYRQLEICTLLQDILKHSKASSLQGFEGHQVFSSQN